MNNGSFAIVHGSDSIYHNGVEAKFDLNAKTLTVLRNKTVTPYHASYFDVAISVDLIKWNMESDSIGMQILNGKDLLPATFESEDFFDYFRYKKLARFLNFHPINSMVHYARKYGNLTEFYIDEMVAEYNIDKRFAIAAAKILKQYGFAEFDRATGLIRLNEKAFHYYDASARKTDFDNLMISSKIADGPNAYIELDSGKLNIRGVKRFYMTTDFGVYAEPKDSLVTILQGRNLQFDGMVHAGAFRYKGAKHEFDYEGFVINMPQIDSIRLTVPLKDTTNLEGARFHKTTLKNHVSQTSGVLYIDKPENKSGNMQNSAFPYFISNGQAIVYFDGPEVLNGAYDKSVKFIIPPFEIDSIDREDGENFTFEGTFNSGGIFPAFDEALHVQGDKSLGFVHQIPEEGYNLYGTDARTYETLQLSNKGIRGKGQIDFITSTIYSEDFIYYPDSVTAAGTDGVISPGAMNDASYPEAVLGSYDMHWLPRKDSMYLRNIGEPFKFYNATATLDGEANITTKGVYGSGTMLTRGSRAVSQKLNFREHEYDASHANFEILTDNPDKPAMQGDDVKLEFDLINNTAKIQPEQRGVAALSFPFAQMKTSITEAVWDLENSTVVMSKSENVAIEDSYFYTTREDLDSLAFNAERAIYDINTYELNIQGIPYITVADSRIIPAKNEITVLENSVLQPFENAEIIIDTLNGYHYLDRASIRVFSRNKFEGNAFYKQIIGKDTFDIRFDSFELQEVSIDESDRRRVSRTRLMTVSGGEVEERQNLIISPGFIYKGSVTMFAYKKALELEGAVKLKLTDPNYDHWILFERIDEDPQVRIPFDNAQFDDGTQAIAGIHVDLRGDPYATFVEKRRNPTDKDFFLAKGLLSYSDSLTYKIENEAKTLGESYQGHTMIYSDSSKIMIFEGLAQFFNPTTKNMKVQASVLGAGNKETGVFNLDAMLAIDFEVSPAIMDIMALDLADIIERIGMPSTNDISLQMLYKFANMTDDGTAKEYEQSSLKNYTPLVSSSRFIEKPLFISEVKMKWSPKHKTWHNTAKLGISHILRNDINAKLDGFIEIKEDDTGADVLSLFLQAAPGIWYYFGYSEGQMVMLSSNPEFNEAIQAKSQPDKSRSGEIMLVKGDESEVLKFINDFRLNYFGIKEPYNLISPDDINLEDQEFDTIQEDEDEDGFGFE